GPYAPSPQPRPPGPVSDLLSSSSVDRGLVVDATSARIQGGRISVSSTTTACSTGFSSIAPVTASIPQHAGLLIMVTADPRDVPLHRPLDGIARSTVDGVGEVADHPIEVEGREAVGDAPHHPPGEREAVRVAAQEGHRPAVRVWSDRVTGENHPAPLGPARPVGDRAAGEVASDAVDAQPGPELPGLLVQLDPVRAAPDPLLVRRADQHRRVQRLTPRDLDAEHVRVAGRDSEHRAPGADP